MEGLAMLETKITNVLTDASSKKLIQHSKLSKLECILQLTISRWQAEPLKKRIQTKYCIYSDWQSM